MSPLSTESTVQEALPGPSAHGEPTAMKTGYSPFLEVYFVLLNSQYTIFPQVILVTMV